MLSTNAQKRRTRELCQARTKVETKPWRRPASHSDRATNPRSSIALTTRLSPWRRSAVPTPSARTTPGAAFVSFTFGFAMGAWMSGVSC